MRIYDCFMYFDEEMILEIRLNALDPFVDHFIIVESIYNHKGEKRNLQFNINKFKKFEKKIIYIVNDDTPNNLKKIKENDTEDEKSDKYILNAILRENSQRNSIAKGLDKADNNDLILVSDVDEIPNLSSIDLKKINKKIIFFNQFFFYYKFNLYQPGITWVGTKGCKKKDLINPQWLRNIKDRIYPIWRIDVVFSKTKYNNIEIVINGGWHFSNIKSASSIHHKLKSYLHHREFDVESLTVQEIKNKINNKQAIYDLRADKRENKVGKGPILEKFDINKLPNYIQKNIEVYKEWID